MSDRLLVLQAAPESTDAYEHARQALPGAEGKRVDVEVDLIDVGNPRDKSVPATARVHRLAISTG